MGLTQMGLGGAETCAWWPWRGWGGRWRRGETCRRPLSRVCGELWRLSTNSSNPSKYRQLTLLFCFSPLIDDKLLSLELCQSNLWLQNYLSRYVYFYQCFVTLHPPSAHHLLPFIYQSNNIYLYHRQLQLLKWKNFFCFFFYLHHFISSGDTWSVPFLAVFINHHLPKNGPGQKKKWITKL